MRGNIDMFMLFVAILGVHLSYKIFSKRFFPAIVCIVVYFTAGISENSHILNIVNIGIVEINSSPIPKWQVHQINGFYGIFSQKGGGGTPSLIVRPD